jgi:hypothetical protein
LAVACKRAIIKKEEQRKPTLTNTYESPVKLAEEIPIQPPTEEEPIEQKP